VTATGKVAGDRHIHEDVPGAPYKIGAPVRVAQLVDETGDKKWLGKAGVVKYFDYTCGCGQTFPDDPMIGVELPRGGVEEFWKEELQVLSRRTTARRSNR